MSLTINTAATHTELTSLNVVKSMLGTVGSSDDGVLTELIQQASDFIVSYTGRKFAREVVTETLPAQGALYMLLKRRPIVSVDAVSFNGSTVSSTSYEIDDAAAGILFRSAGWTSSQFVKGYVEDHWAGDGKRLWSIQYTSGYITPGAETTASSAARNLPHDIEAACVGIVKSWFLTKDEDPNIAKQTVGDAAESRFITGKAGAGLPPAALTTLNTWRSVDI